MYITLTRRTFLRTHFQRGVPLSTIELRGSERSNHEELNRRITLVESSKFFATTDPVCGVTKTSLTRPRTEPVTRKGGCRASTKIAHRY